MEGIETGYLLELMYIAYESVDIQFQAWMAMTFAAIVAVYTGRRELGSLLRCTIVLLYLLGSLSLFFRWGLLITEVDLYQEELLARGIDVDATYWPALRLLAWIVGTVVTCLCVFFLRDEEVQSVDI